MPNLEIAQYIWEQTTKSFDKIEDNDKKEWFNNLIDELEENSSINWVKDKWNSMSEEQKEKLYKRDAITVSGFLKHGSPAYQLYNTILSWVKNTSKHWWKNALKYSFLEQIPCRFFVELWILNRPKSLDKNTLIEDVRKDAKNFNTYLWICEAICTCIPKAKAAVPFIGMAKHYSKWYKDHWVEVVIQRINNEKKIDIKQHTNKELANIMGDIQSEKKPHKYRTSLSSIFRA